MPLTPEDVDNTRFTTVRLREGYDMQEVDLFLDEVQEELARLNRENDELRDRLAAVMGDATVGEGRQQDQSAVRPIQSETPGSETPAEAEPETSTLTPVAAEGEQSAEEGPAEDVTPADVPVEAAEEPEEAAAQEEAAEEPITEPAAEPTAEPAAASAPQAPAAVTGAGVAAAGGSPDRAFDVLTYAQRTADQLVADARSEADRLLADAKERATTLDEESRAKASALEQQAKSRAENLDNETKQRRHELFNKLETEKEKLDREVEVLRNFEREYRSRLKVYLENELRKLETVGVESSVPGPAPDNRSAGLLDENG